MLDRFLIILIYGLATYRLARILSRETGPFKFFEILRRYIFDLAAGAKLLESKFQPFYETLRDLINCPYCVGVWISLILSFLLSDNLISYLVNSFAIAGVQTLLQLKEDDQNG